MMDGLWVLDLGACREDGQCQVGEPGKACRRGGSIVLLFVLEGSAGEVDLLGDLVGDLRRASKFGEGLRECCVTGRS
ncbi:hypothetical protein, partial [Micromonospora sp. CB01531]|uniref:hypothetical protein n=1 Tax=Micromonospora sp. CB01531 TaxID=1718947 RepID=UPI001A7E0DF7